LSSKFKREKKKENKKKKVQGAEEDTEQQKEPKKNNILSMLDRLDDISVAKSRVTEEKLRKSLIDNQQTKKLEDLKKKDISIIEVKKEIEELRRIKQDYYNQGDDTKSIEIAKKIIKIANTCDMKLIINEEKNFIEQIQAKTKPKKYIDEQIEELKKKRHTYYTQQKYHEAIQIAEVIIDLAKEANLLQIVKTEENFVNLIRGKIETSDTKSNGQILGPIEKEEVMLKEPINIHVEGNGAKEKSWVKEEKHKLEEAKENFELEKQILEEQREAFKWEKEMLEELKKHEKNKDLDNLQDEVGLQISVVEHEAKMKFEEKKQHLEKEIKKFEFEKSKLEELNGLFKELKKKIKLRKRKLKQEKREFEQEKIKFEQEKIKFQEEKDTFKWEKKMFEEVKKYQEDEDSS
jgi:hypothetical protein